MPVSQRGRELPPFHVMELLAKAQALEAQGRDIVHMEVGEPDFPTPQPVLDAITQAMQAGQTKYTPAGGLPQLRAKLANFYQQRLSCPLDAERVLLTPGASGALQLILSTLFDVGDCIHLTDPGYPCNRNIARLCGVQAQSIPVKASNHYVPTIADLEAAWQANSRGLMLASPANPTGSIVEIEQLKSIAAWLSERNAHLIVDEIYQGLVYDTPMSTVLKDIPNVIVINSFSKYFGMTGWRLGWLVASKSQVQALERAAQNLFLAPVTVSQYGALAALSDECQPILESRRQAYQQRRDYLLPAVKQLGFRLESSPQGAFYLYADAAQHTQDSYAFCADVLEQAGVVLTPGIDFGSHQANTKIRFAYTTGLDRLKEGMARLATYLN